MSSGNRSEKSGFAIKETDCAICARMALSLAPERAIIAGTSCGLRASLSAMAMGVLILSLEAFRSIKRKVDRQNKRISSNHSSFTMFYGTRQPRGARCHSRWHLGRVVGGGRQKQAVGLERLLSLIVCGLNESNKSFGISDMFYRLKTELTNVDARAANAARPRSFKS